MVGAPSGSTIRTSAGSLARRLTASAHVSAASSRAAGTIAIQITPRMLSAGRDGGRQALGAVAPPAIVVPAGPVGPVLPVAVPGANQSVGASGGPVSARSIVTPLA